VRQQHCEAVDQLPALAFAHALQLLNQVRDIEAVELARLQERRLFADPLMEVGVVAGYGITSAPRAGPCW
jgi:hypothetical protein